MDKFSFALKKLIINDQLNKNIQEIKQGQIER